MSHCSRLLRLLGTESHQAETLKYNAVIIVWGGTKNIDGEGHRLQKVWLGGLNV